jgi:hypothetical protein
LFVRQVAAAMVGFPMRAELNLTQAFAQFWDGRVRRHEMVTPFDHRAVQIVGVSVEEACPPKVLRAFA